MHFRAFFEARSHNLHDLLNLFKTFNNLACTIKILKHKKEESEQATLFERTIHQKIERILQLTNET